MRAAGAALRGCATPAAARLRARTGGVGGG
jgi:hypothetical protein